MSNKKTVLPSMAVYLLAFGVLALVYMGATGMFAVTPAPAPTVPGILPGVECSSETTPDVNIKTYDLANVGTALTETTNLYRKSGTNTWSTFTAGTETADLEPFQTYDYIVGISTSDFTDNAYGPSGTFTVKCQPDEVIEIGVHKHEIETELSATFYNDNHDASAQAISTSETKTVSVKWEAGVDEVYGNPFIATSGLPNIGNHRVAYPNLLQLKLNTTELEEPDFVKVGGVTMNQISCGTIVSATTGFTNYCYEAPVITEDAMEFDIKVKAKAVDPTQDGTAYLFASNFYIDSDTGTLAWGNENEDGAALGADAADSVAVDLS